MKVGIMQPYLFPYLAYFQLIGAVDVFIIYDDVNYMKGKFINRNYILMQGTRHLITLPTCGASSNKLINEISISEGTKKFLETIRQSYSKSLNFKTFFPVVERIVTFNEKNLAKFLANQLKILCDYLQVKTKIYVSSSLDKDNSLRGQEKIFSICKMFSASHYLNAPGGKTIYSKEAFAERDLQLLFIEPKAIVYKQFNSCFIPNLSIIDVLMFNTVEQSSQLLLEYNLV